ncbi:MAG: hypothetical protein ACYTFO_06300 [Planctomycetota bacterium]|jgi:hypothetical protein
MSKSFVITRLVAVMAVCAGLLAVAVAQETQPAGDDVETVVEDAPTIDPPQSGSVTGTVAAPELIQSISLVSRATADTYEPSVFDAETGAFAFGDLPGDAAYDLIIETTDGRSFEGIDLSFADARLLRMAAARREELGTPPEETRPFTEADATSLAAFVRNMIGFMDIRRVLYIRGHGRRATMLLELIRTDRFHADNGHVIWRVELWYFEHIGGIWQAVAGQARVVRRFRGAPDAWRQLAVEFRPDLSVMIDPEGQSEPVTFEIPEGIAPSRGRPSDTEPHMDTRAHVDGLDAPPPPPEDAVLEPPEGYEDIDEPVEDAVD